MDNQHLNKVKPQMQGNYYQLDTTIPADTTYQIDALNGRAGVDTMRVIPIAFTDDGQPHDLTDETVELRVQDAAGVVKLSDKVENLVSSTGGLLRFGVPAPFYQMPGEIQHGYFVLKDKAGNAVSTINVDFTVLENGIDPTQAQSKVYLSQFDEMLNDAKEKASAVALMNDNNRAMVSGYTQMLKDNQLATMSGDNNFTGKNAFTTLKVENLQNEKIEKALSDIPTAAAGATAAQSAADQANASAAANSAAISRLSSTTQDHTKSISSLTTAQSAASQNITDNINNISAVQSTVDSISASDYQGQIDAAGQRIDSLSNAVGDAADTVAQASSIADTFNSYKQTLENSLSAQNSQLTAQVQEVKTSLANVEGTATQASFAADEAKNSASSVASDVRDNYEAIQSLKTVIASMKAGM